MVDKTKIENLRKRNLLVFDEPNQVRIEFVRGCNLNCQFCGRSRDHTGKMTKETLLNIVPKLTDKTKRISVSLQGEPTLHPDIKEFIGTIREYRSKAQILIISNTEVFKKKGIEDMISIFDYGVNFIQADLYSKEQKFFIISELQRHANLLKEKNIIIKNFYKDKVHAFSYKGPNEKTIILTDESELFNTEGYCVRRMHNWGGNLALENWKIFSKTLLTNLPYNKVCKEPYKYMTIGYDGIVDICCSSGSKSIDLGNINTTHILDLWQGKDFQQLRLLLSYGYRKNIISCFLCDQRSFRIGLYPYWGEKYFYDECVETSYHISKLSKKEPLYNNFQEYIKTGLSIPYPIQKIIEEAI